MKVVSVVNGECQWRKAVTGLPVTSYRENAASTPGNRKPGTGNLKLVT
jgi:hypothetical protein